MRLLITSVIVALVSLILFIVLLLFLLTSSSSKKDDGETIKKHLPLIEHRHHDNDELESIIDAFAEYYPQLTRAYSVGHTTNNNRILALEISDNPGIHEPGEPEIKLVANIHGNEVVGREILLHLIDHLLSTYHTNSSTKDLVDNLRIHIVPSINPDGYQEAIEGDCMGIVGRRNANNVDLNRNFPDRLHKTEENARQEKETLSMMSWTHQYPFVLSASLHGGSLVVNYPYDNNENNVQNETKCPDDAIFRHLSLLYSSNHPQMYTGLCDDNCERGIRDFFIGGITNGAAWYPVTGGMQDWNYVQADCFELTIEMGCKKYPLAEDMEKYWLDHKNSLLKLMNAAHTGIHGFVFDTNNEPIENAIISVKGIDKNVKTYKTGDYWRLLIPNQQYDITASKSGYLSQTITIKDIKDSYQQNFTLEKSL